MIVIELKIIFIKYQAKEKNFKKLYEKNATYLLGTKSNRLIKFFHIV